jgi:hypothetical protein
MVQFNFYDILREFETDRRQTVLNRSLHSSEIRAETSPLIQSIMKSQNNAELASVCRKINDFDINSVLSALDQLQKLSVQGKRQWVPKHEHAAAAAATQAQVTDQTKVRSCET